MTRYSEFRRALKTVSSEPGRRKHLLRIAAIGVYSCLMVATFAGWATQKYMESERTNKLTSISIHFNNEKDDL